MPESPSIVHCGICGDPCSSVLLGSVIVVDGKLRVVMRCPACAALEEAEAITGGQDDGS